jgi:membrane-associated phospholipid phosphatase
VPVTVGIGAGLAAYTAFLRTSITPNACNWCDGSRPDGVNGLDRFFRDTFARSDPDPPGITSHVISYGLAPVMTGTLLTLAANYQGHLANAPVDLLITAEATLTAVALSEVLKAFLSRERPGVHQTVDDGAHAAASREAGALASFPSGHTLAIFALTSSAGTIAAMRRYRLTPLIWGAGTILGIAAAYLRIAANQHYFTDTIAGAGIGLGVGTAMPLLFHGPVKPTGTGVEIQF